MSESIWYHTDLAGEQRGPVTADEIRAALARGEIPADARFWREGLVDWVALEAVAADLGVTPPAPPALPRASFDIGRDPVPRIEPMRERAPDPVAAPGPVDPYAAPRGAAAAAYTGNDIVYAGFLRRWAALVIDELIIFIALFVVLIAVAVVAGVVGGSGGEALGGLIVLLMYPVWFASKAFYYASQESSVHQATLGKRLLGIKVTGEAGHRLTFGHAIGRWFAAALSHLTIYVGFLMAAFTERKVALHDMVAGTLVVDKWAYTAHPERQKRESSGCLIALVIVVPILMIGGIFAAIAISQYQDYVAKSQVSEAPAIAEGIKPKVAEYYFGTQVMPSSNDDLGLPAPGDFAGKYVGSVAVGADGIIRAEFNDESAVPLRGASLRFTPTPQGDTMAWDCSSDTIAQKFCPRVCTCR